MSDVMFVLAMVAYEVIAMLAARAAFPHTLQDGSVEGIPNTGPDRVAAAILALIVGHLWPLAAPVALILWKPRKTPQQIQEENRQMRQHIAELERELGIGHRP